MACYPDRLYDYLQKWIISGKAKRFICTIKLQGGDDLTPLKPFQALTGAMVTNLFYNKHEATLFLKML